MSLRSKPRAARARLSLRTRVLLVGIPLLMLLIAWWARTLIVRLMPIEHEGVVLRINTFHKGWRSKSRQDVQFSILFADGFDCEGYDSSFANVREGDRIEIRAYHDVQGWPFLDPEWWECDEGQLVKLIPGDQPEH